MSMKSTIMCGKSLEEPSYFHLFKHVGTGEIFLEIGEQCIRLSHLEAKTLVFNARCGFEIYEEGLDE